MPDKNSLSDINAMLTNQSLIFRYTPNYEKLRLGSKNLKRQETGGRDLNLEIKLIWTPSRSFEHLIVSQLMLHLATITVIGRDKTGVVARVTNFLFEQK